MTLTPTGGATPGFDYDLVGADGGNGPWTVAVAVNAGATMAHDMVTISGNLDEILDDGETVILTPSAGGLSFADTLTITDSPAAGGPLTVTMDLAPATAVSPTLAENGGTADIQVDLSRVFAGNLAATFQLTGTATAGDDYQIWYDGATVNVAGGQFTITFDGAETQQHLTLQALHVLPLYEGDETFGIELVDVTSPGVPAITEVSGVQTGLITDADNMPVVQIGFGSGLAAEYTLNEEIPGTVDIVAQVNVPSQNPIVVPIEFSGTATQGVDYNVANMITMPAAPRAAVYNSPW